MEAFFEKGLDYLIKGGPGAVITILVTLCLALGWVIRNQQKTITMLYNRYNTVVDKKIESDDAMGQSLNHLRDTMFELVRRRP